jgi:hypothetical protein
MTDESGQPLLDQTDDEGVTLRERLAQSSEQLDRVRSDPRVANSPLAGIFDALGGALGSSGDDEAIDPPEGADTALRRSGSDERPPGS